MIPLLVVEMLEVHLLDRTYVRDVGWQLMRVEI